VRMNLITAGGANLVFARFIINGVAATTLHFSVLTVLIECVHVSSAGLANGIASMFGMAASYMGSKFFVFESADPMAKTLPRFLIIYAMVAVLHVFVLSIWTDVWKLHYPIGFFIATAGAMVLTFLANRFFVFSGSRVASMAHQRDGG